MKYHVIKLRFQSAVHFGGGLLESAGLNLTADTLFSAICHEMLLQKGAEGIDRLVDEVRAGRLKISDAFPFSEQNLFLPKPAERIQSSEISDTDDSSVKKMFKKLRYIPVQDLHDFLSGTMSQTKCRQILEMIHSLGTYYLKTNVRVYDGQDKDPDPYYVGGYRFRENNGLWFVLCAENDQLMQKCADIIHALEYSGIGGKRSSGYGRFTVDVEEPSLELKEMLEGIGERYMSLSSALPKENELESVLPDASYILEKHSGFVCSDTYADSPQKKREMHLFASGSCFSRCFQGDVFDVSDGGAHPVYRYAVPLMLRVR